MTKKIEVFITFFLLITFISVSGLAKAKKVTRKSYSQEKYTINHINLIKLGTYEMLDSLSPFDPQQIIGQALTEAQLDCLGATVEDYYWKNGKKISVRLRVIDLKKGRLAIIFGSDRSPLSAGSASVYVTNYCMLGMARLNNDFTSMPMFQNSLENNLTIQQLHSLGEEIDRFYQKHGQETRTDIRVLNPERGIVAIDVVEIKRKQVQAKAKKPQTPLVDSSSPIASIRFFGNTVFDTQRLLGLPEIASLINRPVNEAQLKSLEQAVNKIYREEGYMLAQSKTKRATSVVLEVYIFEGIIDTITVNNKSDYEAEALKHYLSNSLCSNKTENCNGKLVRKKNVERAVGLLSDLPGTASIKSTLLPGRKEGTTKVAISVDKAETPIRGYVSLDNYGVDSTGKTRVTGGVIANNVAGNIGDQLVLEATATSEASNMVGQVGYGIPVGYDGMRAGVNLVRSQYHLGGDFKDLESKGFSNTLSLWASYPLIRSQMNNLSGRVSFDYSTPRSFFFGEEVSNAEAKSFSVGLSGQFSDHAFLAGSYNNYGITLRSSNTKTNSTNALINKQTRSSTRLQWNFSRNQGLMGVGNSGRVSAFLSLRGQHAQKTLDFSERFSLGGPTGVRAYPAGEGVGDKGMIGSLELRYNVHLTPQIPGFLTMGLFYDHGTHENVEKINGSNNKKTLEGMGVSVNLSLLDQWTLDFAWAKRKDSSPVALTETDPKDSRFWVRGVVRF